MSTFGDRLQEALELRGISQSGLARATGVSQGRISKLTRAEGPPKDVFDLARVLGVRPEWLALGEGAIEAAPAGVAPRSEVVFEAQAGPDDDVIDIPVLDIRVAAGPGNLVDSDAVAERLSIPVFLLRRMIAADPRSLVMVSAQGDSMEPTIREGELLVVDTSIRDVQDSGIYVVVVDGEASVKRVQRVRGGGLLLISDNTTYRPAQIDSAADVRIAGRVRSVWRAM